MRQATLFLFRFALGRLAHRHSFSLTLARQGPPELNSSLTKGSQNGRLQG